MTKAKIGVALGIVGGVAVAITLAKHRLPNPSKMLMEVPVLRQTTAYSCGPATLAAALGYYGKERRETDLIEELGASPDQGTSITAMRDAAIHEGLKAKIRTELVIDDLRAALRRKQLAIIEMQAWSETPKNYKHEWDEGHYVVLIGIDNEHIYFMDPAILGGRGYVSLKEFDERWHDISVGGKKLHHTALFLEGKPNPPPSWQRIE